MRNFFIAQSKRDILMRDLKNYVTTSSNTKWKANEESTDATHERDITVEKVIFMCNKYNAKSIIYCNLLQTFVGLTNGYISNPVRTHIMCTSNFDYQQGILLMKYYDVKGTFLFFFNVYYVTNHVSLIQ